MRTVLLIAATTGYQIRSFGEAAAALGIRIVIASDRCGQLQDPWWDGAIPVRFHRPEASVAAIREALAGSRPDGILAVGDRPAVLAAHVAAAFALPGNPPAAAAASRNKRASREMFARAGLPTPSFRAVPLHADPAAIARETLFPAVIKPLALSGSRGVMRVDGPEALVEAFERLRRLLRSPDVQAEHDAAHAQAIVESYIPGQEFAIDGVLTGGELRLLAIFDKPDPLDGPFFEETLYVTPSRAPAETQCRIVAAVAAAARALGLRHGPLHAECRVDGHAVFVLEVAARPIGGLCSKALRFVHDRAPAVALDRESLEAVLLRHAVGEDLTGIIREPAASGVMMIPIPTRGLYRGVTGVDAARAIDGVDQVQITAKPDMVLVPLPEGRSYLGFIFAHAPAPEGVERALRQAHARLRFEIQRELPVI